MCVGRRVSLPDVRLEIIDFISASGHAADIDGSPAGVVNI
jgi:hypothetical protein